MNVLHFVLILGLFYTDHGKCLKPEPMKYFNIKKFSGLFFIAAVESRNPTGASIFNSSTCGKQNVTLVNKRATFGKWKVDLVLGFVNSSFVDAFRRTSIFKNYFHTQLFQSIEIVFEDGGSPKRVNERRNDEARDVKSELEGTFYLPNRNRGLLKSFNLDQSFAFDYTVLGTDYKNWAAVYSCADVTPGITSEVIFFFLRDLSKYDELVTRPKIQKSFAAVTNKSLTQIRKLPYNNCPTEYYQ